MSHIPLKFTEVNTLGISRVCDMKASFDGASYQISLGRLGVNTADGFVQPVSAAVLKKYQREVKRKPIPICRQAIDCVEKIVPFTGRDRTACVLTEIKTKILTDGSQMLIGNVIPYGQHREEFENFLNINLNGMVAIIPTFCGRKVDGQLSVEFFERFEIYALYVPPQAEREETVLREVDEGQATII